MRDLSKAIWAPVSLSYGRELSPLPLKWLNLSAVAPNAATLPLVVFTRSRRIFSLVNVTPPSVIFPARFPVKFWRVALRKTNSGSLNKSLKLRDHLGTCASFNQTRRKFITEDENEIQDPGDILNDLYNIYTVIFIFYSWQVIGGIFWIYVMIYPLDISYFFVD